MVVQNVDQMRQGHCYAGLCRKSEMRGFTREWKWSCNSHNKYGGFNGNGVLKPMALNDVCHMIALILSIINIPHIMSCRQLPNNFNVIIRRCGEERVSSVQRSIYSNRYYPHVL